MCITVSHRMEPGREGNPGRVAQTTVEVLAQGFYQGRPVTKLRLVPRTGRRHQLRVHCLCLGHPIVGDYTYNTLHRNAVEEEDRQLRRGLTSSSEVNAENVQEEESADRMMLHAFKLM
jgi:23S rRNA-/tRNA-specific pseudouridylate synthase